MPAFAPDSQMMMAHAVQVGDRINTTGLRARYCPTPPLSLRVPGSGIAVLFRYGVVVLINLSPQQERDFLEKLSAYVSGKFDRYEEEVATIRLTDADEDQVPVGGPIQVKSMSHERLLVIADTLAKSVVLAHDERQVASVFEVIEPLRGNWRRVEKPASTAQGS